MMNGPAFRFLIVILLAVTSMALLRMSATIGPNIQSGDSAEATQTVRSYYSALNLFLAGGEIDDLAQYFGTSDSLHTTAIRWDEKHLDWSTTLNSLRSTFPNLQFELEETWTAGDLVMARTVARTGEARLPYWLNGGSGPDYQPSIEAFRVANEQIVEHWSSGRPIAMSHPLVSSGSEFWLDTPAQLTISELTLAPSDRGPTYVSVTAPGIAIPMSGHFTVEGNGLVRIASSGDSTTSLIPLNEKAVVSAPQMLVMPRGRAVIWQDGGQPVKVLLMSLVPGEPEPRTREHDGGQAKLDSLLDVLRGESGSSASLWFGTAHVLTRSSAGTLPGLLSLDLTQVVVPPGESLQIDGHDYQLAMFESPGSAAPAEIAGTKDYAISEIADRTRVFLIIRVCSLGFALSEYASCAASGTSDWS
jgi:hypothetical protein